MAAKSHHCRRSLYAAVAGMGLPRKFCLRRMVSLPAQSIYTPTIAGPIALELPPGCIRNMGYNNHALFSTDIKAAEWEKRASTCRRLGVELGVWIPCKRGQETEFYKGSNPTGSTIPFFAPEKSPNILNGKEKFGVRNPSFLA